MPIGKAPREYALHLRKVIDLFLSWKSLTPTGRRARLAGMKINTKSFVAVPSAFKLDIASLCLSGVLLAAGLAFTGCQTGSGGGTSANAIRMNAGASVPYTDPAGHLWLPDQGFVGGKTVDRGNINVAGTQNPVIYRTEHYGMSSFSQPVPNGAYTVKLHFAETYEKVTQKGQRVFSVKLGGTELKDLDVVARAGATKTAWVQTFPVTVTDGKFDITFTPGLQKPEINGIEILPR